MDDIDGALLFPYVHNDRYRDLVSEFLARGANPNQQYYGGRTLLHIAAESVEHNTAIVYELINAGADINSADHLGVTPLHFSVVHRKYNLTFTLIDLGAFVNAKTFIGMTPLHLAVTSWICTTPTADIVYEPDMWMVESLLDLEDIDYDAIDSMGETALMNAVENEQRNCVSLLLLKGADPNICNTMGETPLHKALVSPTDDIHEQLLHKGASIYIVDKMGQNPLDVFIRNARVHWTEETADAFLKLLAFKYYIRDDFKIKLRHIPLLWQIMSKYSKEVDRMRFDYFYGNVTIHDLIAHSFNEFIFDNDTLRFYQPVLDKLLSDLYPGYFGEILHCIPKSALYKILEITVRSRNNSGSIYEVFESVNALFSSYLSNYDYFNLIAAFSNDYN